MALHMKSSCTGIWFHSCFNLHHQWQQCCSMRNFFCLPSAKGWFRPKLISKTINFHFANRHQKDPQNNFLIKPVYSFFLDIEPYYRHFELGELLMIYGLWQSHVPSHHLHQLILFVFSINFYKQPSLHSMQHVFPSILHFRSYCHFHQVRSDLISSSFYLQL